MAQAQYTRRPGKTELGFPNSADGTTTVFHPFLGPANYKTLFNPKNFKGDTRMPRGVDYADFLHAVYVGNDSDESRGFKGSPEAEEVKRKWFYVPNVKIWTPKGFKVGGEDRYGVYFVFDEKGLGTGIEFNQDELEGILRGGDKMDNGIILADGVGFAPRDAYGGGEGTSEQFAEDGQMVIDYTPKGAEKLVEVSETFQYSPRTWIVDNPNGIVKRVSALVGYYDRLGAGGNFSGADDCASSFGVRR